eukprot:PLAT154.4.p1 GENE.PLAT154.4~~PLAT154.4.p1  ORF type:complete len:970 (+),score=439.61 PLAT154.4:109-3018(+)
MSAEEGKKEERPAAVPSPVLLPRMASAGDLTALAEEKLDVARSALRSITVMEEEAAYARLSVEHARLHASALRKADWKNWGPYVSERAWGTVREDYSADGSAWSSFPHDHARLRAYRWNEDGLAGWCNRFQNICMSVALWNGKDPILKERLFGLTGDEGNHGEDVKEYYFYLDSTPTHSYAKMLYKYPHDEYPYELLVRENGSRDRLAPEFELLDAMPVTWATSRYFDVFVEYAKEGEEDTLCRITAHNRGKEAAPLHLLPQIWARNVWAWGYGDKRPLLSLSDDCKHVVVEERHLGRRHYYAAAYLGDSDGQPVEGGELPVRFMFTDNDTDIVKAFGVPPEEAPDSGFYKDAFHEHIIGKDMSAINPEHRGTKAAALAHAVVPPAGTLVFTVRFTPLELPAEEALLDIDASIRLRKAEADAYYAFVQRHVTSEVDRTIQRQAFAGLLWSKQFYHYGVDMWLEGDPTFDPPPAERKTGRNSGWKHLYNLDIISMPDKWEYPWYAGWDLAFHTVPLCMVDGEWAKRQLLLMLREWYMHPSGQMAAYEWNFSDVNPPVHAWACMTVYRMTARTMGHADVAFLERCFHKLLLNFTWWINQKDSAGRNLFEGGFLGLDNIGVIDRSAPLPEGMSMEQADGTAWMAMYCLDMLSMALELARTNIAYEDVATKFFEHFITIASAMSDEILGLWDSEDGFFYDVLRPGGGEKTYLRCRSFVGLIPLFAVMSVPEALLDTLPRFKSRMAWFLKYRPHLLRNIASIDEPLDAGMGGGPRRLLAVVDRAKLVAVLTRMLDEDQFLSRFGLRSLSKEHAAAPYTFKMGDWEATLRYEPGESSSDMYGGNSNWRGPIWFPTNFLMIQSLYRFHDYYGDTLKVECPVGSGDMLTLEQVAQLLSHRLIDLFRPRTDGEDASGHRPAMGDDPKLRELASDEHWRDLLLFYEYFHGCDGTGVGASHQTGWTALVATLIDQVAVLH